MSGYRNWAIVVCLVAPSLEAVSSTGQHGDFKIRQTTVGPPAHKLPKCLKPGRAIMARPVAMDEPRIGGKGQNISKADWRGLADIGPVGRAAVVGTRARATKQAGLGRSSPSPRSPSWSAHGRTSIGPASPRQDPPDRSYERVCPSSRTQSLEVRPESAKTENVREAKRQAAPAALSETVPNAGHELPNGAIPTPTG